MIEKAHCNKKVAALLLYLFFSLFASSTFSCIYLPDLIINMLFLSRPSIAQAQNSHLTELAFQVI